MKTYYKQLIISTIAMVLMTSGFAQNVLEEIIVTANKRDQTLQDIPMNISVLTGDDIEERGIYRPEDYLRTLAGVSTPGGDVYYTIRGLNTSSAQTNPGTANSFMNEIQHGVTNLYDMDRIEVLRGPQGTLYGSNAVGGTIRYITNKPDPEAFEANVTLEWVDKKLADSNGYNVNAMFNVPISDTMAIRGVVTSAEDPGIYQNIKTGRKDVGTSEDDEFRVAFLYEDGPLTINAMIMRRDRFDFGMKEKGNADKPGTADVVDPNCEYSTDFYYGPTCTRNYSLAGGPVSVAGFNPQTAFYSYEDEWVDVEGTTFTANIAYDFGNFQAILIYADYNNEDHGWSDWSRIDTDDEYPDPLEFWGDSGSDSTEIRFSSTTDSPLQWTVGYFESNYDHAPNFVQENEWTNADGADLFWRIMGVSGWGDATVVGNGLYPTNTAGDLNDYRGIYGTTEYFIYGSYIYYSYANEEALFGQIDYDLGDWTVSVGLRSYDLEDGYKTSEYGMFYIDYDTYDTTGEGCDGDEPTGVTCNVEGGKEDGTRPKVTLSYEVNDDLTLFAVSSAGYRQGGNNAALPYYCIAETVGFKRRYTSDEAKNKEIGIKSRGGNFNINATFFWVDWQDIQVVIRPACGWSFTYNGGEAETKGLEIDGSFNINDNLTLDFAGSFISAKITKDIASLGATAGDRLPNVTEDQFSIGLSYTFNLFSKPTFARFDLNYYGDAFATFAEDPADMSPSYSQLNFNIGMAIDDTSKLQLSVSNLTDNRSEAFRFSTEAPSYRARNYLQWIPPRTVSVAYSKSF